MLLSFTLTMPERKSNERWSGDGRYYAVCRWFGRDDREKAHRLLAHSPYYHDLGGWVACITVEQVTAPIARKIKRRSQGFGGYDWMVDSLCEHGEIQTALKGKQINSSGKVLCFTLTMPASAKSRWSGEGHLYAVCRWFDAANQDRALQLLEHSPFFWDFGNGWLACVTVAEVTRGMATKIQRKSAGFCGYQWMVSSLCEHGEIQTPRR